MGTSNFQYLVQGGVMAFLLFFANGIWIFITDHMIQSDGLLTANEKQSCVSHHVLGPEHVIFGLYMDC